MPSLYDVVRHFAGQWPDKLAVLSEADGSRTYGQLADRSARLGHTLARELGCGVGTRATLWLENRPEWIECNLAMQAFGLPGVAANPDWVDDEYEYVLRHSGARVLFTDVGRAERALELAKRVDSLHHVVVVDGRVPGALDVEELIAAALSDPELPFVDDDVIEGTIAYTSGTTAGRPKAVPGRRELLAGGGISYEEMFGLSHRDRAIVVTPFFHGNGGGALMSALSRGASAVITRRFSRSRFWDLVDLYRPTYLLTLQPIMNILMTLPPGDRERSHSLRVIISLGSAPVRRAMEERYGCPVMDWYGMTEAGAGTYTRLDEPCPEGSVGKPFPGSKLHIVRDDGTPAAPGEVGEIVFERASIGFDGYVDDEEASRAAIEGSLFRTGDLGYVDEDGFLFFVDRTKDIVRRGGENISSIEVESVLREHPALGEVAIVAKPHDVLGETLAAFATLVDGATAPTLEELREWCAGRLADFKIPEDLVVIDEFPRTGSGKVQKFALRERLRDRSASVG